MNMLEALTLVRHVAAASPQMATKRGVAALKVMDRKIQSLMRKKAWRDGGGAVPIHMGQDSFTYPIPADEPVAKDTLIVDWLASQPVTERISAVSRTSPSEEGSPNNLRSAVFDLMCR